MNPLFDLILIFLKVGTFTIGGAAAIFPILSHELVDRGAWLSQEEFLYGLALSEGTPGPAVMGMAIAGVKWAGILGGTLVVAALIVPGLLWMGLAIRANQRFQQSVWIQQFLKGVEPTIPALMAWLALRLISQASPWPLTVSIIAATLWLVLRERINPAALILGGILLSWVSGQ